MEVSGKLPSNEPVLLSSVPEAGDANVFRTQVEVPALEIGRYGPNAQPVLEQLLLLPVCAAVRAETVHAEPVQVAVIWVSALSGVGPSATVDWPPPTFRPPQPSDFRRAPPDPPERTEPQVPPGAPVMKRSVRGAVVLVDDVVVVEVLVLLELVDEVLVVVLDEVLVLVVMDVLVLVVVDVLVLVLVVEDVLVVVVEEVLVLVLEELLVLVDVVLLEDVLELVDVVLLVDVVGGPLLQSVSEPGTAPSAMNWPG